MSEPTTITVDQYVTALQALQTAIDALDTSDIDLPLEPQYMSIEGDRQAWVRRICMWKVDIAQGLAQALSYQASGF